MSMALQDFLSPGSGLTNREIARMKTILGQEDFMPEVEGFADVAAFLTASAGVCLEVYKRASDRGVADETLRELSLLCVRGFKRSVAYREENSVGVAEYNEALAFYPPWMWAAGVRPSDDEF